MYIKTFIHHNGYSVKDGKRLADRRIWSRFKTYGYIFKNVHRKVLWVSHCAKILPSLSKLCKLLPDSCLYMPSRALRNHDGQIITARKEIFSKEWQINFLRNTKTVWNQQLWFNKKQDCCYVMSLLNALIHAVLYVACKSEENRF